MIDDGTGTLKQAVFIGYKQIQINLNCSHCQNLNRIKLNLQNFKMEIIEGIKNRKC